MVLGCIAAVAVQTYRLGAADRVIKGGPPDSDGMCRDGEHLTILSPGGAAWCYAPCGEAAK